MFYGRTRALIELTPSPLQFRSDELPEASIWLSVDAVSVMVSAAAKAGRQETGGILIGRYSTEGWVADVVEATPKPPRSQAGWNWFQRSASGLAELLKDRWKRDLHYLGEWHFHPGGVPSPSAPDVRAMQKIARDAAYNCASPILLILGGYPGTSMTVSATLFRDGRSMRFKDVAIVNLKSAPWK